MIDLKVNKKVKLFLIIPSLILSILGNLLASENLTKEEISLLELLDEHNRNISEIAERMLKAKPEETVRFGTDEEKLIIETAKFFNELLKRGKGTQAFQKLRGTVPDWKTKYLGIERALMMGRALIVQKVFKETLIQFYNENPEAIGTIYGEMDIGTWVKMQTKTLQFDKDIDFSSLATDDNLNIQLRDLFVRNLQRITGVSDPDIMIKMDALITPHGKASAEVFIGEWGKTFAEMDLLARGKWKLIMLKLEDGSVVSPDEAKKLKQEGKSLKVVDIQTKEMPGTQMFWWRAFLEGKDFDPPKVSMQTEPMLSLEMSRHLIADIERGNYTGVDKLLKMMKYVERSYLYNQKATAPYRDEWDPFDDNDRVLGEFAVEITKAKQSKNASIEMAKVMDKYKEELDLEDLTKGDKYESDSVLNQLLIKAKKSIIKNAEVALALRLRQIASIKDDIKRNQDLDQMLDQMSQELEAYKHHVGDYPEGRIKDIIWLAKKLRKGTQWSPDIVKQTMDDLIKELDTENYQIDEGIIEFIFSADDARELRIYLRETMKWTEERINKFIEDLRKKFPNLSGGYDRLKNDYENIGKELPTFKKIHKRIVDFNEEWSKTIEGSRFIKTLEFADNLITIIQAGLEEENLGKAAFAMAGAFLKIKATGAFPSLQIAEGIMEAYNTGDTGPAIKAFAFYYFPTIGTFYGIGEKFQQFDIFLRDKEFLYNIDSMRSLMVFDPDKGHIIGIKTGKYSDVFEFQYSPNEEQRANNFADFFMKSNNLLSPDELPKFRFWVSLIPRDASKYGYGSDYVRKGDEELSSLSKTWIGDKLGIGNLDISGKKAKYNKLKKYFADNEELLTAVLILENANEAPRFSELAGPKLAKKREEIISTLEYRVERAMWKSLFYLLEASATPQEDLKQLIEKLEQLELDLFLTDTDMKDLRGYGKGLMNTIKKEIKDQISKDYYGKFVYERYYKAYSQIRQIQSDIIQLWTKEYNIDWKRIISSPFKYIIGGSITSAPRLILDIDKDLENSMNSLSAHKRVAAKIDNDLRESIGHIPKTEEELGYRRELAQIGFEIEHLFDDCNERILENCSTEIQDLILKKYKQYRDFLANLKSQPCIYQYSDWSTCDSETKKQTRRLISKSPERCVEKEKPELERECKKEEADYKKQKADNLWNECIELTKVSQYEKALQKCEESLNYWSDEKRVSVVGQLREQVRKDKLAQEEKERLEKEKFEKERKEKEEQEKREKEKKIEKPLCIYEYSEWGPCDRQTKKQTRKVIAKKPEGCEERQKPVLEKECTPPPKKFSQLTENERKILLDCICNMSVGPCGEYGGGIYHPDPVPCNVLTPPEHCKAGLPCLGCGSVAGRHPLNPKAKGIENCYKNANVLFDEEESEQDLRAENRKHMEPLKVAFAPDAKPIRVQHGDFVKLIANVEGGIPGYVYSWSGSGEPKDNTFTFINTRQPGSYSVSVTVTDSDGNTATASTTIVVESMKVKLKLISPKENTLPIGSKVNLLAEVFSGDKLASGTFYYQWQPHPEVVFGDPQNLVPETREGAQSKNTALFKRIGNFKVWVDVFKEIDGQKVRIGESEQIPINIINLKLKLQANKTNPMVGEKVIVTVQEEPRISDEFVSFWWEYSGNIDNPGPEPNIPNSRAYSFKLKDIRPVSITVHGKAKEGGDDLGEAKITITAKSYQISISQPRYLGPKPKIWKCDTQFGGACPGLVEVADTEFAVFRDIFMKAIVTPTPESPRFRWTVDPAGSCGFPGAGDEIKLNCSQTGTYTVKVEVTNADSIKLGEAEQTFTVSISQEQLQGANNSKQAYDKIQQAKQQIAQGKLDEAIGLAKEAMNLDSRNTEAENLFNKWKKERDSINKNIENINRFIKDKKFAEAENELNQAKAIHPKYIKVIEAENRLKEEARKASTSPTPADSSLSDITSLSKLSGNWNGHTYQAVLVPDGITWQEAKIAAERLGGYLAAITSAAENDFVYNLVKNDDRFWYLDSYHNGIGPWIGGYQPPGSLEPAGGWRWITNESFSYSNWAPGEPNNFGGNENRIHFFGSQTLKGSGWNDVFENAKIRGYIIEFDSIKSTTSISTPADNLSLEKQKVIFDNGNIAMVYTNPTRQTTFTINKPHVITLIKNYHWNNGKGSTPGTIALRDQDGRIYGPWQAKGSSGQGGVPNAYWTVYPDITLPSGTYTVIDSEPSTWAQNSDSGGAGFARVEGYLVQESSVSGTHRPRYLKVDLSSIGGVAGLRGGEIKYKDKVPIGGNVIDGGKFYLPWFSSNIRHTNKAHLVVNHFRANTIYILADCAWWGNFMIGKPVLRFTINGKIFIDIVSGVHIYEWNAPSPSGIAPNTEKIKNNDQYGSSVFISRFNIPEIDVDSIDIELLIQTPADNSRLDGQPVIELFGVTLGYE